MRLLKDQGGNAVPAMPANYTTKQGTFTDESCDGYGIIVANADGTVTFTFTQGVGESLNFKQGEYMIFDSSAVSVTTSAECKMS